MLGRLKNEKSDDTLRKDTGDATLAAFYDMAIKILAQQWFTLIDNNIARSATYLTVVHCISAELYCPVSVHLAVVVTNLAVGGYASVSRSRWRSVHLGGPWAAGTAGLPPLGPPLGTVY